MSCHVKEVLSISFICCHLSLGEPDPLTTLTNTFQKCQPKNAVAILAQADKTLSSRIEGIADVHGLPLSEDTHFLIGSVSKQFLSAGLLLALQKTYPATPLNELMERSIASYLDSECPIWEGESPEWADQITLEHLLNHRSGLVEIFNEELVPEMQQCDAQGVPLYKQPLSTGQIISMIKKKSLLFKPGSEESYNNTGYLIAKEILAKITDMPYDQAIQELLLTPLQLAHTHILPSDGHFDEYAKLHPELAHSLKKNSSGEWIKGGDGVNFSYTHGPGFLTSTANDLLRWNIALHRDQRVLSHEAYRYMIESKCGIDEDNVAEYGLLYGHQGSLEGFEAFLGYFPKRELSIIVISNTSGDSGAMKLIEELFPN